MKTKSAPEKKIINLILLASAIFFIVLFTKSIVKDYYFLFQGLSTKARVISVAETENSMPYQLTFSYYNQFTKDSSICSINVYKDYGNSLKDSKSTHIQVYYTSYSPCDVYLNNSERGWGLLVLHSFIWLLSVCTAFFCINKLYRLFASK